MPQPLSRVLICLTIAGGLVASPSGIASSSPSRIHLPTVVQAVPASRTPKNQGSPPPRDRAAMATGPHGEVTLYGGSYEFHEPWLGDTWTWDGLTWTRRAHVNAPPPRYGASIAYDAALGEDVMFGGNGYSSDRQTWTWDGSTWKKLRPVHSPPGQFYSSMAYDAADQQVVLFGEGQTWTWNGMDWTKRHPGRSPSARVFSSMAYDAASGKVLLFGGLYENTDDLSDTWTWNGTNWTKLHPAHSPSPRSDMGMAYDAISGEIVLFGGVDNQTWTWDGLDWTQQNPTDSPTTRESMGMAYDPALGNVLLFGGVGVADESLADTWSWNGSNWVQRPAGTVTMSPNSGPRGTVVGVGGWGFLHGEYVQVDFVDSTNGRTLLATTQVGSTGDFVTSIRIPRGATLGRQRIRVKGMTSGDILKRNFTVTPKP